jgi:membrane-bound serine protease (ClpP class)
MRLIYPLVLLVAISPVYGEILKVEIDGIIDPISSEFIQTSVATAEKEKADFLLIRLATPGGLGISMQEIVQTILNSEVPVVCYVSPKGAHAASAGFFILLSADVAVMAPGTNTGAAHPVFPFGMENEIMLEKVKNDSLANLRSIVNRRERNYELAEKGVLESKSYTAKEALDGGLIDLIADSEEELLDSLVGMEITRFGGETVVLKVEKPVRVLTMTYRQRILSAIANPNFALILGVIGLLGVYLEFQHPGLVVPGVIGAICLILALLGFSLLPVNFIGVLLIILALGLFIAEVKVQGFGILGFGGIVAMVLGIIFLIDAPYPELRINWGTALAVAVPFALIVIFLLRLAVRSQLAKVITGNAGLVGLTGESKTEVNLQGGKVFVGGELWRARSRVAIPAGQTIRVVKAKSLELLVEAVETESGSALFDE